MNPIDNWIIKSKKNVTFVKTNGNDLIITYTKTSSYSIKIYKSKDSYCVEPMEFSNLFDTFTKIIDKLNKYCIENNPSKTKILEKFVKYVDKYSHDQKEDDFSIRSRLTNLIETSKMTLLPSTSVIKIKNIYEKQSVAQLMIDEYLACQNIQDCAISITDNLFVWKVSLSNFSKFNCLAQFDI